MRSPFSRRPRPSDVVGDEALPVHRRGARAPTLAVGSLVTLSLCVYALPALLGHPVLPGDDLSQNFPLRVLVGRQLTSGHLPVFDPYIWSGAPLLAGWNAGAAYPLTWLFAVLPAGFAWATTLVVTATSASVGCYAFLRTCRLGVLASWVGGLTFAFGGAMTAQVPHVGFVAGMSWVPFGLCAVVKLTEPSSLRPHLAWTCALAAVVGLVVLSGEPRAVSDAFVVLVVFALWRIARVARRGRGVAWLRGAVLVGGGGAIGVALGAVQLVPGLAAVSASQRAAASLTLYSAGSLPIRWLSLLGIPDLLGGSGSLGQPRFLGSYSLTEVTCYVGLLPLVAALALFGSRRSHRSGWLVWEVVGALGVVMALGGHTPLAGALAHVPLFGGQRLPSRAILVTDLALAVLLAYWVDRVVGTRVVTARVVGTRVAGGRGVGALVAGGRGAGALVAGARVAGARGARVARVATSEMLLGSVGPLCVACLAIVALALGPSFFTWVGVLSSERSQAGALGPWLVVSLALSTVALTLVWGGHRLGARALGAGIAAFVVADLVFFTVATVVAIGGASVGPPTPGPPSATLPDAATPAVRPVSALGIRGRFAVYDPGLYKEPALDALVVPDMNVLTHTFSVQGYSSLANAGYARETGAHGVSGTGQDVFTPLAATNGVLDSLDTQDVFTLPRYLVVGELPGSSTAPSVSAAPGVTPQPQGARDAGTRVVREGTPVTWYFGRPFEVTGATLPGSKEASRVGVVSPGGGIHWMSKVSHAVDGISRASWPRAVLAIGLVALGHDKGVVRFGPPSIHTADGSTYALDGELQTALVSPHWRETENDGPFSVFENTRAVPPLTLNTPDSPLTLRAPGATVHRVSGSFLDPTAAAISSPRGVDVVRAVAAIPGWRATWTPRGARASELSVERDGVVQVVHVPPGDGVLRWRYSAPGLTAGLVASGIALAVLVGLLLIAALARATGAGLPAQGRPAGEGARSAAAFRRRPGARARRQGRERGRGRRSGPRRPSTPRRAPGAPAREGGG